MVKRAYLDIETTGLSWKRSELTLIGVGIEGQDGEFALHQLYEDTLNPVNVYQVLAGVERVYTYNGRKFDLPFIKHQLGTDLEREYQHRDLMYDCWRLNLKGGLKRVEQILGIQRDLPDADGFDAVRWWWNYILEGDEESLQKLLLYNSEDVSNLLQLRVLLKVD